MFLRIGGPHSSWRMVGPCKPFGPLSSDQPAHLMGEVGRPVHPRPGGAAGCGLQHRRPVRGTDVRGCCAFSGCARGFLYFAPMSCVLLAGA